MADQSKSGWNPVRKEHVIGFGAGVVAMAIFSFGYPGWFMSRSAAEEQRVAEVSAVHAQYCLDSYLSSGVTTAQARELRSKATSEQAEKLVAAGHAVNEEIGRACGRQLDKLTTEAEMDAAIKKASAEAAARESKLAGGTDTGTNQTNVPATTQN